MRRIRFTSVDLMISGGIVATLALLIATTRVPDDQRRAHRYAARAARHRAAAARWLEETKGNGPLEHPGRAQRLAEYHLALRFKYERALREPMVPLEPDPPPPD